MLLLYTRASTRHRAIADNAWLTEILTTRSPLECRYTVAIWGLPVLCDLLRAERVVAIKTEALQEERTREPVLSPSASLL